GVTNVSVFKNKSIVLYDSVPVGGDHITNDISIGLRISSGDADKLKREYGLALTSLISNDHEISVNELDGNTKKTIKVSQVVEIIEARIQEIFFLCKEKLEETGEFSDFSGEIVLAGGGISYMDGSVELAKEVFGLPARLVAYRPLGITNPEYLTSIAILRYVADRMKSGRKDTKSTKPNKHKKEFGILKRIAGLFNGLF
ncbi:MAG TPA: cell division FtsA domain-containing protein, partial [Acetivibrio sp.]|nr:cell division FtsA domain-containing protein [Acetivibrio sp.]